MQDKKIYVLITARKGSKGIKNKNLKKIKNKSLVELAVDKVKNIKKIHKVFCSSDDEKIMKICKKNKIHFIKRPKKFCMDGSSSFDVVKHFASYLKKNNIMMPYIILLIQPTSPFLKKKTILDVIDLYKTKRLANSINSFVEVDHKFNINNFAKIKNKKVIYINRKNREKSKPRQKNEKYFAHGNLHSFKLVPALKSKHLIPKPTYSVILKDKFESIDIDDKYDLFLSRLIQKNLKKNGL